ncbi:MAG: aldehyde-activating protein, partial [Burkholderiales bacterium PBB4]
MPNQLEGGCLCGAVRFKTRQAPMRTLVCHCTFCQRVTGSSFYAESMFANDAVVFNAGQMSCYEHVSDSSQKKVYVHFCTRCGTTVSLTFERWPAVRAISRGCYDAPDAV